MSSFSCFSASSMSSSVIEEKRPMVGLSFLSSFIAFGSEIDSLCIACTIAPTMAVA